MNKYLLYMLGGLMLGAGIELVARHAVTSGCSDAMEVIDKDLTRATRLVEEAKKL